MKKNISRVLALVLALVMVLSLTACGQKAATEPAAEEATPVEEAAPVEETAEEAEEAAEAEEPAFRDIVDMAGRTLTIPTNVEKVMGNNAMAQAFMYTLAPDKMSSLGSKPREGEAYFYLDSVKALPVLGDNSGKKVMNPEEVVAAAPDFILHVTMITDAVVEKAEELQAQLNIPVVIVSADLADLGATYRYVGEILGCEERAETLATYAETVVADIAERAASIPEDARVTYYYAEGDEGLMTDPSGSDHTRAFDAVGAVNCVSMESYDTYFGRENVSMELILELDPDVVVFCPVDSIYTTDSHSICQDLKDGKEVGSWQILKAIQEGKFCEAPYGLANAIDRPATVNLLYGCQWLGSVLYPDYFDYDMAEVTKEFYSLFYHYDLTDAEVETLLSRATIG